MKEQRKDEESKDGAAATPESKATPPTEAKKPAGLNFVFKIAPADPKNSFDFEDVADK
jgi:hypothetical protein